VLRPQELPVPKPRIWSSKCSRRRRRGATWVWRVTSTSAAACASTVWSVRTGARIAVARPQPPRPVRVAADGDRGLARVPVQPGDVFRSFGRLADGQRGPRRPRMDGRFPAYLFSIAESTSDTPACQGPRRGARRHCSRHVQAVSAVSPEWQQPRSRWRDGRGRLPW